MDGVKWFDVSKFGVEGKGWDETERFYDRFPLKAKGVVPDGVWSLSRSAIGMCAHFKSDSTKIFARWTLENGVFGESNFNVAACAGVDLYSAYEGSWRWVAAPKYDAVKSAEVETCLVEFLPRKERAYRLYLPMRNPVLKLEIGVEEGSSFEAVAPRRKGQLVYYGTSIAHGAYASRSGMGHPQMLGRRLGLPLVNLGFSGSARMELPIAGLLAELDASIYVLDALPNMDLPLVEERAEAFIRALCSAKPKVPVVLVEDHPAMISWLRPEEAARHQAKWKAFSKVFKKLVKEGFTTLSYVKGEKLFGTDNEASVDGTHPSDLGFMRMTDILEKALKKALSSRR